MSEKIQQNLDVIQEVVNECNKLDEINKQIVKKERINAIKDIANERGIAKQTVLDKLLRQLNPEITEIDQWDNMLYRYVREGDGRLRKILEENATEENDLKKIEQTFSKDPLSNVDKAQEYSTEKSNPDNEFSWVPFHKELAKTLLDYRERQGELIEIIQKLKEQLRSQFDTQGISLRDRGEDGDILVDVMDPFTFFAAIHRRMKREARILVTEVFKNELDITADRPSDFAGLPTRNPQNNRYFPFKKDREPDHIDSLWDLAEFTVSGGEDKKGEDLFGKALSLKGNGISSVTQGMFWLNPEDYMPIDDHTKKYLEYKNTLQPLLDRTKKGNFSYIDYTKILNVADQLVKDFPTLSKKSYEFPRIQDISNRLKESFRIHAMTGNGEQQKKNHEFFTNQFLTDIKEELSKGNQYETTSLEIDEEQDFVENFGQLKKTDKVFDTMVSCGYNARFLQKDQANLEEHLLWGTRYFGPLEDGKKPTTEEVKSFFNDEKIIEELESKIGSDLFFGNTIKANSTGNHYLFLGAAISSKELSKQFESTDDLVTKISDDLNYLDRHNEDWGAKLISSIPNEKRPDSWKDEKGDHETSLKSSLAPPFSDIFQDRKEAEWALDLLHDTFQKLGLDHPGDERVTLSLRYDEHSIHFTFGNWFLLGFNSKNLQRERLGITFIDDLVDINDKYSSPVGDKDRPTFSTNEDEPTVTNYRVSIDTVKSSEIQEAFEETLELVRERFESWNRSNYRKSHVPELEEMIFDDEKREELLSNGISDEDSSDGPTKYWKISPGRDAKYWDQWKEQEIITIGWNKLGDLSDVTEDEYQQRKEELEQSDPEQYSGNGPNQTWKFAHEMSIGDKVVISHGINRVLAIGTVTGDYHTINGEEHIHRRAVEWDDLKEREVHEYGWRRTLIELDQEKFERIEAKGGKSWDEQINVETGRLFQIKPEDQEQTLHFPEELESSLENQVSGAIQAGKHIILVGPPGTGKSKLAKRICDFYMNGDETGYEMTTATSDWSTFDTIGGLMPDQDSDGEDLTFHPGLFLKRFKQDHQPVNQWLIVDEINRADIDKAFGSLFSVLTGDSITLSHTADNGKSIHVRPEENDETIGEISQHEYVKPDDWRMIATMNTYDKSSLYEMSYAFMRRFAFIPVGIPEKIEKEDMEAYVSTWEKVDPDDEQIEDGLKLWNTIRKHREIGPAIVRDLFEHIGQADDWTSAVILYVFPQFEGLREDEQVGFVNDLVSLEFIDRQDRLEQHAIDFLGINEEKLQSGEDEE